MEKSRTEGMHMARERMIELVSESICVSKAAAKEALEARNWDVLEAAQLLQRQERARKAEAMRSQFGKRL
jgi:NACalpha-BTF3-like transcription factor